jgi:hypothetical protein
VFADVTPKIVTAWRGRAAVESPSHLRDHLIDVALTLLSALLYCREREITDTLVNLLCSTVHRIGARAEVRVTNQLIKEFKRVRARRICCSGSRRRPWTPVTSWCATRCIRLRRGRCWRIWWRNSSRRGRRISER